MQVWKKSIHWFRKYSTYKTMTLKMGLWPPKSYQLFSLSLWYIDANLKKRSIHWLKRYSTLKTMTSKMRSRSPKSNQLLSLSQWYIESSLKKIHPLVQKIFYLQDCDFENEVKVTKVYSALKLVTMIYVCKFEENPSTGSKDIRITRQWPWKWGQGYHNQICF